MMILSIGTILIIVAIAYLIFKQIQNRKKNNKKQHESEPLKQTPSLPKVIEPVLKKPSKAEQHKKKGATSFVHPWLSTALKGHTNPVLDFDFSGNGKYLASCSEDRSIIVWHTKEFEQKEHKISRTTLDFDHAAKIRFAPDSKSLLLYLHHDNRIVVYKMVKKDADVGSSSKIVEVEGIEFKCGAHKLDLIDMEISCNGKFLMTASSDTSIVVWDLKGNILKTLDTKQGNNYLAKVSPCGRFIACAGFTPDVKVWEVSFTKGGDFSDVSRAFELKGHKSGVRSFGFNQDSSRMVSASKDGSWRLWDTDIRYRLGQEPCSLMQHPWDALCDASWVFICLAPDSRVVAIACDRVLRLFSAFNGDLLGSISNSENSLLPFSTALKFTADSKYLVTARDRQMLVFHNVPGYMMLALEAEQMVKKATSAAHRERLIQQAEEAAQMVKMFPLVTE